jgi:hypothetical protein
MRHWPGPKGSDRLGVDRWAKCKKLCTFMKVNRCDWILSFSYLRIPEILSPAPDSFWSFGCTYWLLENCLSWLIFTENECSSLGLSMLWILFFDYNPSPLSSLMLNSSYALVNCWFMNSLAFSSRSVVRPLCNDFSRLTPWAIRKAI